MFVRFSRALVKAAVQLGAIPWSTNRLICSFTGLISPGVSVPIAVPGQPPDMTSQYWPRLQWQWWNWADIFTDIPSAEDEPSTWLCKPHRFKISRWSRICQRIIAVVTTSTMDVFKYRVGKVCMCFLHKRRCFSVLKFLLIIAYKYCTNIRSKTWI